MRLKPAALDALKNPIPFLAVGGDNEWLTIFVVVLLLLFFHFDFIYNVYDNSNYTTYCIIATTIIIKAKITIVTYIITMTITTITTSTSTFNINTNNNYDINHREELDSGVSILSGKTITIITIFTRTTTMTITITTQQGPYVVEQSDSSSGMGDSGAPNGVGVDSIHRRLVFLQNQTFVQTGYYYCYTTFC